MSNEAQEFDLVNKAVQEQKRLDGVEIERLRGQAEKLHSQLNAMMIALAISNPDGSARELVEQTKRVLAETKPE